MSFVWGKFKPPSCCSSIWSMTGCYWMQSLVIMAFSRIISWKLEIELIQLKRQPHEGELTDWIVNELRIGLILSEQRTFSSPFATGGKSHRNRRRLRRWSMTTWAVFLAGYLNCSFLQNKCVSLNTFKGQPHEGELTDWIVNELRIGLILGEQRTFSCPFATGGKSHRNRRRLWRRPMTTRAVF